MAFTIKYMGKVSSTANNQALQDWNYNASASGSNEAIATVSAANYFDAFMQDLTDGIGPLQLGDCIKIVANDAAGFYLVTAVSPHVTLSSLAPIGAVSGANLTNPINFTGVFNVADSTSSATPGTIRALKGVMTGTNATMTSGSLVGVRGEVDMVGASGGFVYGVQGKVIPTGTLSGSIWAPAVFGQYDLSAATLNAGQIAAIWGDMGASGGTFTDVTGARMFAGTNTIASLTLHSMIYLYGKASNLLELSGSSSTYIAAAGGATPSGTNKTIKISIDGVDYYILASTVYS